MFSNTKLKSLIVPLIIEQVLALTIGLCDTLMVSSCGQVAVSGVSIVDGINVLLINIFSALATGGAVVCSQYLGGNNKEKANDSAKQLILTILIISIIISILVIIFNGSILSLIFGNIENDVMENAKIYFFYSALSYPFMGLFNGGAALFRAMGNSKITMVNSFYMNLINIIMNFIFIYCLHMSVAGSALATLISRVVCAVSILYSLTKKDNIIWIDSYFNIKANISIIKKILTIGIPNGLENGMFQMGKILVQRIVSTFGTGAIAAHSVAFSLTAVGIVPGQALGLAMLTVVGQCIGANDYKQAKYYTKKLMIIAILTTASFATLMFITCPYILKLYSLPKETLTLAVSLVRLHNAFDLFLWPIAFTFPNALRASNDATYTMIVSTFSMWAFRFGLSFVFAYNLNMGVIGVWWAMIVDWFFRAIMFIIRYKSGKWMNRKLV